MLLGALVIGGLGSGSVPVVRAEEPYATLPQEGRDARWTQFTQQDGLVANSVHSILVDERGLWFGGDGGVSYFNGMWSAYVGLDGGEPPESFGVVTALARGQIDGRLWAGTDRGVLAQWNGQRWSHILALPTGIYALAVVGEELWIGTDDGLYRYTAGELILVDAVGRQPVLTLLVDRGTVWVGAWDGLWRYRGERWAQMGAGEPFLAAGVYALLIMPDGTLVVGTPYGVGWQPYDGARWQWYETLDEIGQPVLVQALAVDRTGSVWAGTDGAGAFELRLDRDESTSVGYTGDPNLTTRFVRQIAIDRDGAVWFATPAGVFRYQSMLWRSVVLGSPDGIRNHVNCLLVTRDGALWIATAGSGVRLRAGVGGPEQLFTRADGAVDAAYALAEDSRGVVWAGGEVGLRAYVEGRWTAPVDGEALPGRVVTSLLAEGNRLWIGTIEGVASYDITSGSVSIEAATLGIGAEAMTLDELGQLWVGTREDGIWRRGLDGQWRQFQADEADPNSLPYGAVPPHGLSVDPQVMGGIWAVISGVGIVHWDGERWELMREIGLTPSNLIWTIFADRENSALWIGSESGVTRWDGVSSGTLTVADGLQSGNIYAIARDQNGGMWFGGRSGLSYFMPDSTPPWLEIGSVTGVNVETIGKRSKIMIDEPVRVDFAAGDLQTDPDRLGIYARLAGPSGTSDWQPVMQDEWQGSFDEPGAYTLEVRARDLSFNYSPVVSHDLTVLLPPTFVTLPLLGPVKPGVFRTLVALGAMVVMGAIYMAAAVFNNRRRGLQALARAYNPYISGEPVRRDDMFFGRRELLQRIIDTLHNNSIMIYGERRIGKTTLLYQLVTTLREVNDPDYWFVPIYVDLEGTPQELFFNFLIEEIVSGVESLSNSTAEIAPKLQNLRYHRMEGSAYSDRDFNRDLNRVTEVLEAYGERHDPGKHLRLILLLDEMDVMSKYDRLVQQQLRRIFMREFAATLGAVVAGIQISKDWDRVESPWFNLFNEIALQPFSREQAEELLREPVRGTYQYDQAAIEFIIERANGRPYKLQQYGLEAVNHMLSQRRRRIMLVDAEVAHKRIVAAERDTINAGINTPALLRRLRRMVEANGGQGASNGKTVGKEPNDLAATDGSPVSVKEEGRHS